MSYFYVDDQIAFHPKVMAAGNAAMGVWTRAGSLCKLHTTGGFVSDALALSLTGGRKTELDALVRAGLWIRVEDGYQFHDWAHIAGNGTAEQEKARRDSEREAARIRAQRARANKKGGGNGSSHADNHGVTHGVTSPAVTGKVRVAPVPDPLTNDTHVPPVPDREATVTDDSTRSIQERALAGLGITDLPKIKMAIAKAAGRAVEDDVAITVIADLLGKGGDTIKNPQAYVIASIRSSWSEIQKLIDERLAA